MRGHLALAVAPWQGPARAAQVREGDAEAGAGADMADWLEWCPEHHRHRPRVGREDRIGQSGGRSIVIVVLESATEMGGAEWSGGAEKERRGKACIHGGRGWQ